jgi:hypothetical protein
MTMLVEFAEHELRAAGWYNDDSAYGGLIPEAVLALIKTFAEQGHSGGSAPIVAGLFHRLAGYQALGPLTGADDEWGQVDGGPDMKWQNRRCFHVFKREDGTAWDGEAVIFREPDGSKYTNGDSRRDITFPYDPIAAREYRDVPARDA